MARMESLMEAQYKVSPLTSDAARPSGICSHGPLLAQPQPGELDMIPAWTVTGHSHSLSTDVAGLDNSLAMSYASGKPPSSQQRRPTTNVQDSFVQECTQDSPIGQLGTKDNAEGANIDEEDIVLAPNMVSVSPCR